MRSRAFQYAPIAVFGVVYSLSCLLGALLLIVDYAPFVDLFEYFSGTPAPRLSAAETRTNLFLLIVAPLTLVAGYVFGARIPSGRTTARASRPRVAASTWLPGWLPPLVFLLLASIGLASLIRAGATGRAGSWLDSGEWLQSRSENFARISFFEFVNLYILIPTAAAWVVLGSSAKAPRTRALAVLRWTPVPIALSLSMLLFTRKSVMTVLLIVAFAWLIDAVRSRSGRLRTLIAGGTAAVGVVYLCLVVAPIYRETSTALDGQTTQQLTSAQQGRAGRSGRTAEAFDLADRRKAIALYSVLSPLTRSSAPALYYPVVFPRHTDYFRLDLGLDIAGIGAMPTDNVVVWNYLNPETPGGTTAVPYQFVLYSQVGTRGAVLGSLIVGFLLALAWRLTQVPARPASALCGSMVLLLSTYLGIDSLRNSLVVSYGVLWGVLLVTTIVLFCRIVPRTASAMRRAVRTRNPPPILAQGTMHTRPEPELKMSDRPTLSVRSEGVAHSVRKATSSKSSSSRWA